MSILEKYFPGAESTLLLVIDFQERLCKAMDQDILSTYAGNVSILLEAARELGMPVFATEQYPAGLGSTIPELKEKFATPALEKLSFSCCRDSAVMGRIESFEKKNVLVTGMETHVCVLQTVLDLIDRGFNVHVVSDAVLSRKKKNWLLGLQIMASAGAIITSTETVLFQLLKKAGTPEFRSLSKLVR
jgi:nicotinamidase-related amidase